MPGIPARDLTPDEVALYGEENLTRSGIYELQEVGDGHESSE